MPVDEDSVDVGDSMIQTSVHTFCSCEKDLIFKGPISILPLELKGILPLHGA